MIRFLEKHLQGGSRTARVFRGGAWLGAASAGEQGLRFVRNMILTRLLAPEAFGLMAIVLAVTSLFQVLTGMWIKESVVQNPRGAEKTYLNGIWCLATGRAFILFVAAVLSAPWIASFYEEPELTLLIRVAFLNVLFQGALSPGAYVAVKEMRYPRWVLVQQGGGTAGVLTTILLAFFLQGVWALVIGFVTEAAMRCAISYLACPFRPRFQFDRGDLDSMFRFARGMFGLPVLMLVYTEGTTFVVGKLCTKEMLGLFAMTLTLARVPSMFGGMLVDLLLPSFSELQNDKPRLTHNLLRVTSLITLVALPALLVMALFGEQVLTVVYGGAYSSGAIPLAILFANEILVTCNIPIASLYVALGRPDLLRRFSLMRAILVLLVLYPAVANFGLIGGAAAPLLAMGAAYACQLVGLRHLTTLSLADYLAVFGRGIVFAFPVLVAGLLVRGVLGQTPAWALMASSCGCILVLYGLIVSLTWRFGRLRSFFWPYARGRQAI